tara:strand:- start:189 stop:395 length:207 start_codon:yes stop_codon:yes gene_type:complete
MDIFQNGRILIKVGALSLYLSVKFDLVDCNIGDICTLLTVPDPIFASIKKHILTLIFFAIILKNMTPG